MAHDTLINSNSIAFIGLANEYCNTLEGCAEMPPEVFAETMLKILPRLYIMATDINVSHLYDDDAYLESALDEDYYESIRRNVEAVTGPDDIYLEVFEEDMKFSDTPVSASISEGLADIFQVLFNFLATVRNATDETIVFALHTVSEDFRTYWSFKLCNVLRALNTMYYRR